jgi:hypothetical protein
MWWAMPAAEAATPVELRAASGQDAGARDTHDPLKVQLLPADFEALGASRSISRRFDGPDGAYAMGAIVVDMPKEEVWVAIQDGLHFPEPPVTVTWLPSTAQKRLVYMYVDLPAILSDRQCVVEFTANDALAAATHDHTWQRSWKVVDPAHATHADPDAVWISTNTGAWTLTQVGDQTLVVFVVRTVLGGMLPESITGRWAVGTVDNALAKLRVRAASMPTHYDAAHDPVLRPDGSTLPAFGTAK